MVTLSSLSTPIGRAYVAASEKGIALFSFGGTRTQHERSLESRWGSEHLNKHTVSAKQKAHLQSASKHIREYFQGKPEALFRIPLDLSGTPFQKEVWNALRRIRSGRTKTYGEIAKAMGRPKAFRAVGTACGKNPVCLVVPCHRVVATNSLGGYSGGLAIKKKLLAQENVIFQ